MTKEEFVGVNTPADQDDIHPDLVAVECSNFEGFNPEWVDREIARNGHILGAGIYLYPDGEIIEFYNQ